MIKNQFFSAQPSHRFNDNDLGLYGLRKYEKYTVMSGSPVKISDPDAKKYFRTSDIKKAGSLIPYRQTYTAIVKELSMSDRAVYFLNDGNRKEVLLATKSAYLMTDYKDLYIRKKNGSDYVLRTNEKSQGEDNVDLLILVSAALYFENHDLGKFYCVMQKDDVPQGLTDEEMIRYLIIISENLRFATMYPDNSLFLNLHVPDWVKNNNLSYIELEKDEIDKILENGEFVFGDQTVSDSKAKVGNTLFAKYRPEGQKKWSEEEKKNFFTIPEYYEVPAKLDWACNLYQKTYKKRHEIKNFFLPGRSGLGKSVWAMMFSAAIGAPLYRISCNEEITTDDLLAKIIPADASKGQTGVRFLDSEFLKAFSEGGVILFEEIKMLRPATLAGINSAMDSAQSVTTYDGRTIHRHPDCVIIMTTNDDYAGCKEMNQSVLSRCTPVILPELDRDEMVEQLEKECEWECPEEIGKMVDVYFACLQAAEQNEIYDGVIDRRSLADWVTASSLTGNFYEEGMNCFISKCTREKENLPIFIHCLEEKFESENY